MNVKINIAPTRRGFISALAGLLPFAVIPGTKDLHAAVPGLRDLARQMDLQALQRSRPKKNPSMFCRANSGKTLLYRENRGKQEQLCALNQTGKTVWDACNGKNMPGDISEQLHERFFVSRRQAWADTMLFLGRLKEIGAIQ